jgi:transposase
MPLISLSLLRMNGSTAERIWPARLASSPSSARSTALGAEPRAGVAGAVAHPLSILASRIQNLNAEISDLEKLITEQVRKTAPELLDLFGVGQDFAATLLIAAGDNPDRLAHEAAFAALCGVSPVEMSFGKTQRRRLNRGGNRQANAALFRVVLTRLRCHPETRACLQRRTTEGRGKREIIRCLKRYLARQIYKIIRASIAVDGDFPPNPGQSTH